MNTMTQAVAGEIKAELARRGLSQEVLVNAWGIKQPSVSAKLTGKSEITSDEVESAARALGFDPFEFVARAQRNAAPLAVAS